jgi:hypothetical protein
MAFEAALGNTEFEFVVSEVTLTVVTRRSASRCGVSVLTVWYTKCIYVSFVNCFVVILLHHNNLLLLALTLVQCDRYSINEHNTEFEFVVSEVTLTVVTRRSASGYGVSVLVSVTARVHLIPLFKN